VDMEVADERRERLSAERRRVSGEGASSSSLFGMLEFGREEKERRTRTRRVAYR
jgi:hypothetical protein